MVEVETNNRIFRSARIITLIAAFAVVQQAIAQTAANPYPPNPYPKMAPIREYLMTQDAEIALAKTAAPQAISKDADVLVMDTHGYHAAIKGHNGFVCIVQRSWTASPDQPDFWNPKLRAPICYNAAGARSYLPRVFKRTELALAGKPKEEFAGAMSAAFEKKEIPAIEPGSMCYMLSKDGYLNDQVGHWHPHVMIYAPETKAESWGADLPNSPVLSSTDHVDRATVFMIPVAQWSDGSPDSGHAMSH